VVVSLKPTQATVAAALLTGCECTFPPIEGGSETSRANITLALEDFFAGTEEGGVCIPVVQVGAVVGGRAGGYNRVTHAIRIEEQAMDPDRDLAEQTITTHELCHAANRQLGLEVDQGATWFFETDSYEDAQIPAEAFAYTCQLGPEAIQLIGEACPDDTAGAEAFPFILEQVFTRPMPDVVTLDLSWEPVASTTVPGAEAFGFSMSGTVDDNVRIALLDGSSIRYVSLSTGAPGELSPQPTHAEAAPELYGAMRVLSWASTGEAELFVVQARAANDGLARRLIHRDDRGTTSLGCPRAQEAVFVADGRVWSAYAEGDTVRWGYWHDE
jgi:hypothetical protein